MTTDTSTVWCLSADQEEWEGDCDTREVAIAEGRKRYEGESFYVRRFHRVDPRLAIRPGRIIDGLIEEIAEEYGIEHWGAGAALTNDVEKLQELSGVIVAWLEENAPLPRLCELDDDACVEEVAAVCAGEPLEELELEER